MSSLLSHSGAESVSREQLRALPAPPQLTPTFRPVPHWELLDTLDTVLDENGVHVVKESLALRRGDSRLFGVLDLEGVPGTPDGSAALGLRQGNDRTLSIQLCAGLSVFVCDNMVFRADMIALKRKHTSGLNLIEETRNAWVRFLYHLGALGREVEAMKNQELSDGEAKGLLYDTAVAGIMPLRLLPVAGRAYFNPLHPEFAPRTVWSLHNAWTEAAKVMPLTTRVPAIQALGRFLANPVLASVAGPSQLSFGELVGEPAFPGLEFD